MKLTHPDSTQAVEVDEAAADVYLSQGWTTQPTSRRRRTAAKPAPKASTDSAN